MILEEKQVIDELAALRSENKELRKKLSRLEEDHIFDLAQRRQAFESEKTKMLKIISRLVDDLTVATSNSERWRQAAEALSRRVDELDI